MSGLIYVESVTSEAVTATSDGMTIRFASDGATFAFRLSHHAGAAFEQHVKRNSYPLHCAPDGELVQLAPHRRERAKQRAEKARQGAQTAARALSAQREGERS